MLSNSVADLPIEYLNCSYVNTTHQPQVVSIGNIPGWRLEQVISPGQCFTFRALSTGRLEVYADKAGIVTRINEILCANLELAKRRERLLA